MRGAIENIGGIASIDRTASDGGAQTAWHARGEATSASRRASRAGRRSIARCARSRQRRGALDAEEAQLLCRAAREEIWRALGKASLLEYIEEVLGHGPRAARERVRVALALDELPELADALATGELAFSAVRELSRVATPMTQAAWCERARGKNLRQVEELVSGRTRGDLPDDPPDPGPRPEGAALRGPPGDVRARAPGAAGARGRARPVRRRRRADRRDVPRRARAPRRARRRSTIRAARGTRS